MKTIKNTFHMRSGNHSGHRQSGAQPRIRSVFMRKDLLAIGLGVVLSGATVFSTLAGNVTLRGHVPAIVARGQAKAIGGVDAEKTLDLSIGLPLRNRDVLTNLIQQIYDPSSPNYHHYLTPQQFTEHFGPSEKD